MIMLLCACDKVSAQLCINADNYSYAPKHEIRAVWLTTLCGLDWPATRATDAYSVQVQQQELRNILDSYAAAKINTVFFQTRIRGTVSYPSQYEAFDFAFTGTYAQSPGYDPLAFAIEECHKRGMECHAWVVTVPSGNTDIIGKLGNLSTKAKYPYLCKMYDGICYLDPGHPETKYYLANICKEIVERYDVDGIHMDYIRYPDNPTRFPDNDTYTQYGAGQHKSDWRRNNITAIVREIYTTVKQVKPYVKVSCSPLGKYYDTTGYSSKGWNAWGTVYQDVKRWMIEGIVDMIFPMMYFRNNDFFPFAYDWLEASNGRPVVPGIGLYFMEEANWPLEDIKREINVMRTQGTGGQAYFRSQFFTGNTKGIYSWLAGSVYKYNATVPAMTWQDANPPSPLSAIRGTKAVDAITLEWDNGFDKETGWNVTYNIYANPSSYPNVEDARNILATRLRYPNFRYPTNADKGACPYFAVTVVDRFGNESQPTFFNPTTKQERNTLHNDGSVLQVPVTTKFVGLYISNLAGRHIRKSPYGSQVDIKDLPKGAYLLWGVKRTDLHLEKIGIFIKM